MKRRHVILATALVVIGMCPAIRAAQVRAGQLLVASDKMGDPNFAQTVVLVLHDDQNGTLGVMINRPTTVEQAKNFPDLDYLHEPAERIWFGGPVAPTRLLMLLRNPPENLPKAAPVYGDVVVSADPDFLRGKESSAAKGKLRIYAGHAEWGPGQLDREISAGDWHVVAGNADLVFTAKPLKLWDRTRLLGSGHVVDRRGTETSVRFRLAVSQPPKAATGAVGNSSSLAFRYSSAISPRLAIATALSRAARGSNSMSGINSLIK